MAIDDNTSYELTGAQVKDLANKIKAKAADNTFVGATSAAPGSKGLVPQPQAGDDAKFLSGDGAWGAVTSTNIDWSTMVTTVGSGDNVCYKYPDGTMVALVRVTTTVSYAAWGGIYESYPITPPDFAEEFISTPFCVTGIESGGQAMLGYGSGADGTGSGATKNRGQSIVLMRKDSLAQNFTLVWQAIGRWK